jgi:hypothetical protein
MRTLLSRTRGDAVIALVRLDARYASTSITGGGGRVNPTGVRILRSRDPGGRCSRRDEPRMRTAFAKTLRIGR